MEVYQNLSGDSGVYGYIIGDHYISVKFFNTEKMYTYSYGRAGANHVETMKGLARAGRGLNSYIMKYVKDLYD